jgi:hypothetical protein
MKLTLKRHHVILLLTCILIGVVFFRLYLSPMVKMEHINFDVAPYNNFLIFKWSGFNLLNQLPLYISNDPLHYDLFKYSPSCALAFAPLSLLSDAVGLLLWTFLNIALPVWALQRVLGLHYNTKIGMTVVLLAESFTASVNSQSNGIVLGLLLLALANFQRNQIPQTVLWILCAGFIKIFGWIFFLVFLLKPQHMIKGVGYAVVFALMIILAPLLWVSSDYLISEYRWWLLLLQNDSSHYLKLSFMGWLSAWFSINPPKNVVLLVALIVQIIPLLFRKFRQENTNAWIAKFGASLLLWVVIFNHMSESATYVIAVGGMALFFSGDIQRGKWYYGILSAVVLLTVLGPTDLYPKEWRIWMVETAQLKAFPVIILWVYMMIHLFKQCQNETRLSENTN